MNIANTIFSFTILIVFFDNFIAFIIFDGSSVIMTISAASIALSAPNPPIAIPMSASVKTGASFIPSPTNASFPFGDFVFSNSSTFCTLSVGNNSVYTLSIPTSFATLSPTSFLSPVNIIVCFISFFFSSSIVCFASSFILSAIKIYPVYFPFIAIYIIVPILLHFSNSICFSCISFSFPTSTFFSPIFATIPKPDNSSEFIISFSSIGLLYACFIDFEIGWFE